MPADNEVATVSHQKLGYGCQSAVDTSASDHVRKCQTLPTGPVRICDIARDEAPEGGDGVVHKVTDILVLLEVPQPIKP